MSALVLRVVTSPEIRTEYLDGSGGWSEKRSDAKIYKSYELADSAADVLRRCGQEHAHAAVVGNRPFNAAEHRRRRLMTAAPKLELAGGCAQ